LHHLQARSAAQKKLFDLQKTHLKAAIESDLDNSDAIIDMYRAEEADAQWKELTQSYINASIKNSEEKLKTIEADAANGQAVDIFGNGYNSRIAVEYNQYAWLVANTTGDLDKALNRSRQSLELYHSRNHANFQDTLARCYFAKGDFQNAVKYQRKAVKQEPFRPAMKRQLALFENALKNAPDTTKEKK
jgi:tetratricopeptide (TPR) repeat protein